MNTQFYIENCLQRAIPGTRSRFYAFGRGQPNLLVFWGQRRHHRHWMMSRAGHHQGETRRRGYRDPCERKFFNECYSFNKFYTLKASQNQKTNYNASTFHVILKEQNDTFRKIWIELQVQLLLSTLGNQKTRLRVLRGYPRSYLRELEKKTEKFRKAGNNQRDRELNSAPFAHQFREQK